MSAPLSGPRAVQGRELKNGVEACFRQVNADGGILGQTLALKLMDDAGQPAKAVANTKAFDADSEVVALLGYVGADAVQAALPVAESGRLALIGVVSGAATLRATRSRVLFHLRAGHAEEAAAIVTQLDHMGVERIGVLYQNDSLGLDGLEGAKTELSRLAIRPTAVVKMAADGRDADAAAQSMGIDPASAVIVIANDRITSAFVHAMKASGQNPRYIAVSDADGESLVKSLGALARGIGVSQVVPLPTSGVRPVVREYQAAMQAAGVNTLSHRSLEGYLYARVAVEAFKRIGKGVTRDRVLQALESLDVDLGGYRVRFSGKDHQGSSFTEMTVVGHDGRLAR